VAHRATIEGSDALLTDRVANTRTPLKGVFVFVRRTPTNNVRKCSCSPKNVRFTGGTENAPQFSVLTIRLASMCGQPIFHLGHGKRNFLNFEHRLYRVMSTDWKKTSHNLASGGPDDL
jgi:hypothetical protein